MMKGIVHDRRALLPVTFRVSGQPDIAIEFVIDTGFNGYLMLATGKRPLLGTAILEGEELRAQFIENGQVTIDDILP